MQIQSSWRKSGRQPGAWRSTASWASAGDSYPLVAGPSGTWRVHPAQGSRGPHGVSRPVLATSSPARPWRGGRDRGGGTALAPHHLRVLRTKAVQLRRPPGPWTMDFLPALAFVFVTGSRGHRQCWARGSSHTDSRTWVRFTWETAAGLHVWPSHRGAMSALFCKSASYNSGPRPGRQVSAWPVADAPLGGRASWRNRVPAFVDACGRRSLRGTCFASGMSRGP